jgi:hypothetical protein
MRGEEGTTLADSVRWDLLLTKQKGGVRRERRAGK